MKQIIEKLKDLRNPHRVGMRKWKEANGDEILRLTYHLNSQSIVFDLGGYKGQWASDIFAKYGCTVYIFEPVKEFYDYIVERFKDNENIEVFDFGLGGINKNEKIYLEDDASSIHGEGKSEEITIISIHKFLKDMELETVDLMKINIEGAEYELLLNLATSEDLIKFKNLQIQFHRNVEDYESKRNIIRSNLKPYFKEDYNFPFIWESWSFNAEIAKSEDLE